MRELLPFDLFSCCENKNRQIAPFEKALSYLKDEYALGTLIAKIITPKPF